jgi:hypothetical protein
MADSVANPVLLCSARVMRTSVLSRVGASALCLFSVACTNVDENPAPPTDPFPTARERTQLETTLAVARSPAGTNRVVVAYDDFTSEGGSKEIEVSADGNSFTFRENSSRVGWSRSDDDGSTWVRGGKFRPHAPDFVHISTNADVAVDPGARNVVYMVALGVSRFAWNAVAGLNAEGLPVPPPRGRIVQTGDLRKVAADGVCVGRSDDGGGTFASVKCLPLPLTEPDRPRGWTLWADAPAITVDGAGCVWVAVEDAQSNTVGPMTRLFRTRTGDDGTCHGMAWDAFAPVTPEAAPGADPAEVEGLTLRPGERRPLLRTDDDGDVWLALEDTAGAHPAIQLRAFGMGTAAVAGWNFSGLVPTECANGEPLRADFHGFDGTPKLRVGAGSAPQDVLALRRFDFQVDRSTSGTTRVRYAFTEARTDTSFAVDYFLQVGETLRADGMAGTCQTPTGWSTRAATGDVVQPIVRRSARNAQGDLPTTPEWWVSVISNGGTQDPSKAQVRILAHPLVGTAFGAPRDLSVLTNYPVCSTTPGWWGDYFGLVHYQSSAKPRGIAVISDSRGPNCTRGIAVSSPQHIKAVRW